MDSVDNYHELSGQLPLPWTQWTIIMDSVDNYHGLSGQSWQCPGTLYQLKMTEILLKGCKTLTHPAIQGHSGKCPVSPWTKSSATSQTGQCPQTKTTLWKMSSESMDKVQWDQSHWTMSMDKVQRVHGQSPGTQWTVWTLSMDTLGQCPGSPGWLDNVHG